MNLNFISKDLVLCLFLLYIHITTCNGICNAQMASNCSNTYISCVRSESTLESVCNCYGHYGFCLNEADCIDDSNFKEFINICNTLECNYDQCTLNGSITTSTSSSSTTSGCISNDQSFNCANAFGVCAQGETNRTSFCKCYNIYGQCLYELGCLYGSSYQAFLDACATGGCSNEQCYLNNSLSTKNNVESPFAPVEGSSTGKNVQLSIVSSEDYNKNQITITNDQEDH